jgi:hypothetical protein
MPCVLFPLRSPLTRCTAIALPPKADHFRNHALEFCHLFFFLLVKRVPVPYLYSSPDQAQGWMFIKTVTSVASCTAHAKHLQQLTSKSHKFRNHGTTEHRKHLLISRELHHQQAQPSPYYTLFFNGSPSVLCCCQLRIGYEMRVTIQR